ncbi:TRAP transporter large permease [Piscinibacter sp. XHJ-5]|uniref:TRAP transporter large permease n=1 Tax=Piscinibacter sp. XHJ-5 TaxID=3037797 RepID=UPI00245356BE|nr:TRAP transporter large permease [Piscinibacter sp. XHJ-5]
MSPGAFKLLFLAMMGAGIPVAIAMAGASLVYVLIAGNPPPFVVIHRMVGGIDSFPLLAVPFFILAGNLMNVGGITTRIYNFALSLVGWLKGGLGHVNIVGSVVFAGMSGTAIADAAGLGTIEIKAMREQGYAPEFAVGVTAASATLGPIIPPSLPFVIYGMFANVSVGALFLAGLMPGAVMTLLMMLTVAWFAHRNGWGRDTKLEWHRVRKAFAELAVVVVFPLGLWLAAQAGASMTVAFPLAMALLLGADRYFGFSAVLPIMTPVLLIGGMTTGVFTATEGAIAASVWALFLGVVWYRTLSWRMFVKASMDTVETTATVLLIVAAASIFGWMLTATRTTEMIAQWILTFANEPWEFLLLANALMLFVGCFLEPTAAITILVPILLPIVHQLGIDPIHFGLVMVLNLMIGLLHPPMGLVLFVLARVARLSVERTTMAILPWLVPLLASLALVTFIPSISLWLPKALG